MRSACVILLFLAVRFSAPAISAETGLPVLTLKDSKVGDWVTYRISAIPAKGSDAPAVSSTIRQEIVSLTEEKVTLQIVTLKLDGSAEAITSAVAQLRAPYGPLASATEVPAASGEEKIDVSKTLSCRWVKVVQGRDSAQTTTTLHYTPDVPLGGIVKVHVLFQDGQQTEQKLEAFGRGK